MTSFLLSAALLVAVTLLLLLRPWRGRQSTIAASAHDINTRIYRDQLAELDRDLAAGTIAEVDHAQSRAELQRRLLDDAALAEDPVVVQASRRSDWVIALLLPVLAGGLYAWLGHPAALDPMVRQGVTQTDVDKMVAGLAAKLQKNPDDPRGWTVLARAYRMMGRLPESADAFSHIGPALDANPVLLVEYADVLAARAKGQLEGRPMELVARALTLDPNNVMALSLSATAAFNRKDLAQASELWNRALKLVPPDSEDAKWLKQALAEVQQAGGPAPEPLAASPQGASAHATANAISGRVSLAPALAAQVKPSDTVFVFARLPDGPRMPLAVQRAHVSDLPLDFKLDDSMAMSPQFKLSSANEVRIEARISRSGSATPGPGDLTGTGPVVKAGARDVTVQIDSVRP